MINIAIYNNGRLSFLFMFFFAFLYTNIALLFVHSNDIPTIQKKHTYIEARSRYALIQLMKAITNDILQKSKSCMFSITFT